MNDSPLNNVAGFPNNQNSVKHTQEGLRGSKLKIRKSSMNNSYINRSPNSTAASKNNVILPPVSSGTINRIRDDIGGKQNPTYETSRVYIRDSLSTQYLSNQNTDVSGTLSGMLSQLSRHFTLMSRIVFKARYSS